MIDGKYIVLYNAMEEIKGVFFTLDDDDSRALVFDTLEDAEAEVNRQLDDEEISELREVLIAEVVKRGGSTMSFLWG